MLEWDSALFRTRGGGRASNRAQASLPVRLSALAAKQGSVRADCLSSVPAALSHIYVFYSNLAPAGL